MILFCRKDPQTLFQDFFCPKIENAKNTIFSPKSWVHPFEKKKTTKKKNKDATIWGAYF